VLAIAERNPAYYTSQFFRSFMSFSFLQAGEMDACNSSTILILDISFTTSYDKDTERKNAKMLLIFLVLFWRVSYIKISVTSFRFLFARKLVLNLLF
jgi:hypothetical protein